MDREGAETSLHRRLMIALARGARVQEDSRALVEAQADLHTRVTATLETVRTRRERLPGPEGRG